MNTTNDDEHPQQPSPSTSTSAMSFPREPASIPSIPSTPPRDHSAVHDDNAGESSLDSFPDDPDSLEQKQAETPKQPQSDRDDADRFTNPNLNPCNNTTSISIETVTAPTVYDISWLIDEESLDYACLKNKNKTLTDASLDNDEMRGNQRGVLDTIFTKNGHTFKLELCISGWKNSNRGYCAFYLTIPQIKKRGEVQPLTARYTVSIRNTPCYKQSSVRDDFHLGVGFPNFCTEEALTKSQINNNHHLELKVKVEIFNTSSKIKQIESEIYDKFISTFGAICGGSNSINGYSNPLLMRMYKDKTFCDVVIRCKTRNGNVQLIECHKSILIHSSLVFQKMLSATGGDSSCSFIESQENEINLEDSLWSHFIVYQMIKFLYSGQISQEVTRNIEHLFELFRVAEYYEITSLITECCNQFILTLDCASVCFLLLHLENKFEHVQQIQFIHQNNVLWRFVIQNIKRVKKTECYQQILLTNPKILNKLIDKMTS